MDEELERDLSLKFKWNVIVSPVKLTWKKELRRSGNLKMGTWKWELGKQVGRSGNLEEGT